MKERLKSLAVLEQYREPNLALRNLLNTKGEDLVNLWQNKEFLFAFPRMAIFLISNKGCMEFSKDQRAQIFSDSLSIFLSNNNRQLSGYMFTKDGEIVTKNAQGLHNVGSINEGEPISIPNSSDTITPEKAEKTDTYSKTVIASILLIGMSLKDQEKLTSLVIQSYERFSSAKRGDILDNLGRLLDINSPTRAYIKNNQLDKDNGFGWDKELSYIMFFGIYKRVQKSMGQRLPQEMKDIMLQYYSLETLSVILDYSLDQSEHLQRLRDSDELTGFIDHMATRLTNAKDRLLDQKMIESMQEKLDELTKALSYKKSKSPTAMDSSPNREIAYGRISGRIRHK